MESNGIIIASNSSKEPCGAAACGQITRSSFLGLNSKEPLFETFACRSLCTRILAYVIPNF